MSTTGEQTKHYCMRYGIFCAGANGHGECNTTGCWNNTVQIVKQPVALSDVMREFEWDAERLEQLGASSISIEEYRQRVSVILERVEYDTESHRRYFTGENIGRTRSETIYINSPITTYTSGPMIEYAPVKHGHWVEDEENTVHAHCSECGWEARYYETDIVDEAKYCPNCGALMEGTDDE